MSSSPIIYGGKLVGTVMHVRVNEIKTRYLLQEMWYRHKGVGFEGNRLFLYAGGFDMPAITKKGIRRMQVNVL